METKFETVDWHDVAMELIKLQEPVENLIAQVSELTASEYLLKAVEIHHRITQIHPFQDGNGRCSRAFLNWMLRIKGMPPFYIKSSDKEDYYKALEVADTENNYEELLKVIIKDLFRTMERLEKKSPWLTEN